MKEAIKTTRSMVWDNSAGLQAIFTKVVTSVMSGMDMVRCISMMAQFIKGIGAEEYSVGKLKCL